MVRKRAAPREERLYGPRRPRPPAGLPELRAPGRDRAARSTSAGVSATALGKRKKKNLQRKETQGQQAHPYPASWGKTEANLEQKYKT